MGSLTVSLKLHRLRVQSKEHPDRVFTTLHHLVDVDFLREAYRRTNKSASAGIDRVTGQQYGLDLENNLHSLHQR
jgi:hypothetical protein